MALIIGTLYLDVCLAFADVLLTETEFVAKIGFCLVCNFEAVKALPFEAFLWEEVEDVLMYYHSKPKIIPKSVFNDMV